MTRRRACPPAPGPLEEYAQQFDDLWGTLAQRRGFREYLQGLLLPRDRHKTLTGLVGAEPIVGACQSPRTLIHLSREIARNIEPGEQGRRRR